MAFNWKYNNFRVGSKVVTLWIVAFFAPCIYSRSIIFEMLHLGERLELQMPRGFQHTPFSLLSILVKVHLHPLIIFSHSEASIA